jgi:hypothetical protein
LSFADSVEPKLKRKKKSTPGTADTPQIVFFPEEPAFEETVETEDN